MTSYLCVSIRFLDPSPVFHGKQDGGLPEWPPSPLRLFQAIVDSAMNRWRGVQFDANSKPALEWLQAQDVPVIIAAPGIVGKPFRIAVPNNDLDVVASAWSKGLEPKKQPNELKTMKLVTPVHVRGPSVGENIVHYIFKLTNGTCPHFDFLKTAARSITHLGWGVDMVAGDAAVMVYAEVTRLKGERWQPVADPSTNGYRVPQKGTLTELIKNYQAFLSRIGPEGFKPVPPLSAFRVVGYRRATDPAPRQFAAFSILKPDASAMRSFDPVRRTRDLAGMVRHAVAVAACNQGWSDEKINEFVHGKMSDGSQPPNGSISQDRFQYLPIPTINPLNRVESIRRVMIAAPANCGNEIVWARRAMAGAELANNDEIKALLTILPGSDWVLKQYIGESHTWSTVTPVILPGYDDPDHLRRKLKDGRDAETQKRYLAKLDARVEELIRKAFRQAGFADELMNHAEIEWRNVGYRAGVDLASRYLPPENLNNSPRYHVKVTFPVAIHGPIAVGSGRFRGFGLFAKTSD